MKQIGVFAIKIGYIMNMPILFRVANEINDFCKLLILPSATPFHAFHLDNVIFFLQVKHHIGQFVLFIPR